MSQLWTQIIRQARAIWGSLGLGARVTLLAFAGAAVLLVAVLGIWSAQADYVLLYGGLSPEDAAAMSTRLGDDKVPFRYEASRGAILVPAARADSARLALAGQGLPRNATEGFELFDKSSFGATEFVQRINFLRALQGTLARNIQALDCIESARVTLSIPQDELFLRERQEAKASVVLRLRSGRNIAAEEVAAICHLVASSVPKLDARNVTIVEAGGRMLSRPTESGDALVLSEEQLGAQRRIENHLTDKVQSLLDQVLGSGQAVVRVAAQLNFERVERSSQKMDPDALLLEEHSEDSNAKTAAAGTAPASGATGAAAANGDSTTKRTKTNKFAYNTVTEKVIPEIGALKRLSVAVLVAPKSAVVNEKRTTVDRTPQEMAMLRTIVESAVGYLPERHDTIKVEQLPFNEPPQLSAAAEPAPEAPWSAFLQRYRSDVLAGAALLALVLIFWRAMRRLAHSAPAGAGAPAPSAFSVTLPASDAFTPDGRRPVVARAELQQLVTQNNSQAVDIIRSMLK